MTKLPACLRARFVAALIIAAPAMAQHHPDLQGIWTNKTLTPLERPQDLGNKQYFTKEEAAAFEKRAAQASDRDRRDGSAQTDVARAYNEFWFDRGNRVVPTLRTSLVIDPPDGRIPALSAAAQQGERERAETLRRPPNGPEDRLLRERCILGDNFGPPMIPTVYNNNFQIVQGDGYVAILSEMIHDYRIIPLDGRPHLPPNVRQWLGDSRGHWEGDTLVVDTTNFTGETHFHGADENLHLTERFRRVSPDMILYSFTVDDPTVFAGPWSAEIPMTKTDGPIYEYACHEGNRGMMNLLRGARAEEGNEGK
jgi:hypothetical protein